MSQFILQAAVCRPFSPKGALAVRFQTLLGECEAITNRGIGETGLTLAADRNGGGNAGTRFQVSEDLLCLLRATSAYALPSEPSVDGVSPIIFSASSSSSGNPSSRILSAYPSIPSCLP